MKSPVSDRISTRYRISENTLIVDLGTRMRVLSSAPRGGGLRTTRYILNHQVSANPLRKEAEAGQGAPLRWGDPGRFLLQIAGTLGVEQDCVGLMTAVPMKQMVMSRQSGDGLWVECFATVGVTNAVRAGEPPPGEIEQRADRSAGTINLILITNACLMLLPWFVPSRW